MNLKTRDGDMIQMIKCMTLVLSKQFILFLTLIALYVTTLVTLKHHQPKSNLLGEAPKIKDKHIMQNHDFPHFSHCFHSVTNLRHNLVVYYFSNILLCNMHLKIV